MFYYVYILRTSSNTLYIGQTNNLEKRIEEHRSKTSKSAKYIRYFSSFELVYHERYLSRSEAMRRESQLKKLSKTKKEALIAGEYGLLKRLHKAGDTYSAYNINVYNELFYRYAKKELINELPNLFTKLDLFNIALHIKITSQSDSKTIKVVELASGKKMDRWKTFVKIDKERKWKVLLTDFDNALLPNFSSLVNSDNFSFIAGIHNLFDNYSKLKPSERYDVMLSTYTFDNIWLEDDLHLTKVNNVWYKNLYKLNSSKIKKSIKDISNRKKLSRQIFKDLKIITKRTKINLLSLKHGEYIDEYYKNHKYVSVNYPGGLISSIVSGFSNQLKKDGLFITADIASVDSNEKIKGFKSVNETIKIKIENYALAKHILEKLGFSVGLKSLYEFVKEAGIETPVEIHDHFVLFATPSTE